MSEVTLQAVEAKQTELTAMIAKLRAQSTVKQFRITDTILTLQPGEHYAGIVLKADGSFSHHLVLLPAKPAGYLAWQPAMDWAASVGGALPTRQEQSLLFANCKAQLEPRWHWSSEVHEDDASFAWLCSFDDGYVYNNRKSYEGCARAVRRT